LGGKKKEILKKGRVFISSFAERKARTLRYERVVRKKKAHEVVKKRICNILQNPAYAAARKRRRGADWAFASKKMGGVLANQRRRKGGTRREKAGEKKGFLDRGEQHRDILSMGQIGRKKSSLLAGTLIEARKRPPGAEQVEKQCRCEQITSERALRRELIRKRRLQEGAPVKEKASTGKREVIGFCQMRRAMAHKTRGGSYSEVGRGTGQLWQKKEQRDRPARASTH